jgi:hypothetical protein
MQQVSFSQSAQQALTGVLDAVGTELALFALFCAGFVLFRLPSVQKFLFETPKVKGKGSEANSHVQAAQWLPAKELEANWAAGKDAVVLQTWTSVKQFTPGAVKAVGIYECRKPDR